MPLPHTRVTLANGLDVLVHEDHDCPIVAVNIWYHVGSKNEKPGRTGFAHLFEHLMFEGSEHHDQGYFHPLQEAGGTLNGSTNADRTNYWEVVPTNALELALWMESDRMGYLLPALTEQKFQNQRDVVLNERRQNYENRPYGFAGMALVAALYPPDHPYHWLTIGEAADLRAARARRRARVLPDLLSAAQRVAGARRRRRHGRRAGARRALLRIDRCGRRRRRRSTWPPRRTAAAKCACCSRIASSCRACTSPGTRPALFADGDAEMDLVAELLAGSKTSRLYRALVYDQRIATEIAASQNSREIGGFFQIVATAAPGRTLQELEAAITREIAAFVSAGPTAGGNGALPGAGRVAFHLPAADGRRLRRQVRSAERLQRVPRRSRTTSTRDLDRYRQASAADAAGARRAAALRPRSAASRSASSRAGRADLALDGSDAGVGVMMAVDRSQLPALGPEPAFTFPDIRRRVLANGLRVWTVEHRDVPVINALLLLPAGAADDPPELPGPGGDHRRPARRRLRRRSSALEFHEALGRLGAQPRHRSRFRRDAARPDDARAVRRARHGAAGRHA